MASCSYPTQAVQNGSRHLSGLVFGVSGPSSGTPAPRVWSARGLRASGRLPLVSSAAAKSQHAKPTADPTAPDAATLPSHDLGTATWLQNPEATVTERGLHARRRGGVRRAAADVAAPESSSDGSDLTTASSGPSPPAAFQSEAPDVPTRGFDVDAVGVGRRRRRQRASQQQQQQQQLEPATEITLEGSSTVFPGADQPPGGGSVPAGSQSRYDPLHAVDGATTAEVGAEARVAAAVSAAADAADAVAGAAALAASTSAASPRARRVSRPRDDPEPLSPGDPPGVGPSAKSPSHSARVADTANNPGGGAGAGRSRGGGSAARARVQHIKEELVRKMRAATRAPSADTVKLILTPLLTSTNDAAEPAGLLRGEPLPPEAVPRARSGSASVETRMPRSGAAQRRRRLGQQQQQQQLEWDQQGLNHTQRQSQGREVSEHDGQTSAAAVHTPGRVAEGQQEQQQLLRPGLLKPRAARRLHAPAAAMAAVAAAGAATAVGSSRPDGAAPAGAAVAEAAVHLTEDADSEAEVAVVDARSRRDRLQRDNEAFVRYLEGVALAAAEGEGAGTGGVGGEGVQGDVGLRTAAEPPLDPAGPRPLPHAQQQQQQQQQHPQQVNILRDLAQMFRNFAFQAPPSPPPPPPAAAVATVIGPAAPHPVTEGAEAASAAPTQFPSLPVIGARPARDARLKPGLKPEHPPDQELAANGGGGGGAEEYGPTSIAGAGDALEAGSGPQAAAPTRAALLRLLRPVPKARLPPYTRTVGQRISSARRPRVLRLPVGVPEDALELVGDGAALPSGVLRAARRRAYYYRQLAPRQLEQGLQGEQQAGAAAAAFPASWREEQQQQQEVSAGGGGGGDGGGGGGGGGGEEAGMYADERDAAVAAVAAAAGPTPRARPYSLTGRTFQMKRRAQYSDNVKRAARRSGMEGRGTKGGAAAAAAGGAMMASAASADAAATSGVVEEAEEDPRGEYNPAAEVVNDVYEQIMGVRLPERAMYGRRAEALAAMSPSRIREQARSWIEACGKDYALSFHAREPLLLATPAETLLLSLENLSRLFELPPEDCVQLALRNPAFIGMPYDQLRSAVEAVSEALEVGLQEAGKIVIKCPGLAVRQYEFPVARRMELLAALLPVSKDKLRQVVRQRPQLLSKSAQSLAAFMMNVSAALSLPLFDVSLMIAGCPGVTGVGASRLASRWSELQRIAALVPHWQEQLTTISPPSLGRCLVANEAALARLKDVADRGLAVDSELSNLKKVLTMSASRFEAAVAGVRGRWDRGGGPAGAAREVPVASTPRVVTAAVR